MSGSEETSPVVSPSISPVPPAEHVCPICEEKLKQPKVLSCLHVFCQACLEKQIEEAIEDGSSVSAIVCTICKQESTVPQNGIESLLSDFVLSDILEASAVDNMQIICTSCKAKEKAVARCTDCASYLCPNCVTAHMYMRCFENHKVVTFEEMQNGDGVAIHKPIFCNAHSAENMKFFCNTCQVPICNECMLGEHKQPDHHYERIVDVEEKHTEDLKNLVTESKSKVQLCEESSGSLESALSELQMQRDNAKGLIQETFQSYKVILEKRKDDLLQELEELHSSQELAIMDACHNVEKTVEKIEDGCTFTEHVLKQGSALQILMMKKLVSSQLLSLINNTPKPEVNINLEFHTDNDSFEMAVRKNFGSFAKEELKRPETQLSSLHSSFENEGFSLPPGVLSPDTSMMPPVSAPEFIPHMHHSIPMSGNMTHVSTFHSISSVPPIGTAITGGSQSMSMTMHDRSLSRNSHSPAMSDSGISVDAASTNSSSSAPMVNIAALAKLGHVGFSNQGGSTNLGNVGFDGEGQVTLNGQVIPGLNMNNVSGLPPPSSRNPTPISSSDSSLSNMLSTPTPRSQTPSFDALAGLLNTPAPSMNGMGNMGNMPNLASSFGSMGSMNSMNSMGNMNSMMNTPGSLSGSGGMSMSSNTFSTPQANPPYPPVRRGNKMSAMQIRCKFGQLGPGKGQFNSPHGFCLGIEEDIIVADTNNHRIQVFDKGGDFKEQFGIPGREEGQLWYPRKVAVMRNSGKYVVCDRGNERSRMQIFTKNGHFIKKIAIRYIDIVAGLAITQQGHIVAVDSVSPTVFCIAESGELVKWFDCSDYMREPSDIAISGKDYFVCDFKGHCVVVFNEEGQFLRRIGCENITNYPNGIDISDAGDVLIGDSHGNRFHVAVFQRDGSLIGEFECPYVKVSRCCGLKITSEGYVVTLAKNNHHVLVLNTLYIT